ncbi:LysR family transcriptional regulator [Phascolomyces articulosus]|uniref:LysR family transcriptional regulator n=1 Tax=Phascolomyces articulosus TaxID=60185 RepID=A0AAD5K6H9_9FUNG|nr:LysR family transcriptional regulator [Phascolomyces articulosus]
MVEQRELGKNTGVKLNPLGLGCMGMSDFYGPTNEETNLAVLKRALELGCNVWDSADMYGVGENERLLGKFFAQEQGSREKVFLCTKFGFLRDPETKQFLGVSGKPDYVHSACEASLARLGVDSIDLYYMHRPDPNTPIEETVQAMAELVKEGKVKYIGLSECDVETLRRAHKIHPITAYQIEFSPWALEIETNGILEATRELGISIVAYSPLGRGFLTGAYKKPEDFGENDIRLGHLPRFSRENFTKNLELVSQIESLAQKKGVTPSELVLAWVLAQGNDFFVIPGTKRLHYLEQNIKSGQITLSEQELKEMREIIDAATIVGGRY